MARAVTLVCLALVLLGISARGAAARPKVSVLGVEVTGAIDQTSTAVAHDVTEGLRSKARQGNGPYSYAPNSDRELIDEKVLKNCDSEGPLCMSDIGKDMGTDFLIYGQIAKAGENYRATLHVLDVRTKTKVKDFDVSIPAGSSSDAVRAIAKKAYGELVGGGSAAPPAGGTGTLVITANVDGGTVFVDDDSKDSLSGGTVTLTLPEGRYRVAIEAPGHRRKEKSIKVVANESDSERFELVAEAGGGGGDNAGTWKAVFFVTAGVAVALGGFSAYEWSQELSEEGLITAVRNTPTGMPALSESDCDGVELKNGDPGDHFHAACDHYHLHFRTLVAAGIVGAGAMVVGYFAFFHHGKNESAAKTSARAHRGVSDFAVLPTITERTGGATVMFSW